MFFRSGPCVLCGCLPWPAKQAQAPDAAVGIDVEPHVCNVAKRPQVVLEGMPGMRLEGGARQEISPLQPGEVAPLFAGCAFQAASPRRVPFEVARVDLRPSNRARGPEPDDRPIMPRATPPLRSTLQMLFA